MGPDNTPLRRSQELWLGHLKDQGHSPKTRQVYGQVLGLLDRSLERRERTRPASGEVMWLPYNKVARNLPIECYTKLNSKAH